MSIDYTQIPNLTEEQITALTGLHDADVSRLIINRDDIKQEKLNVQEKLTAAEQVAEDARKAAVEAEEKRLIASGETDKLREHYETQLAEKTATAELATKTAKDALLSRDKGDVMSKVLSLIHDDYKGLAEAQLSNMLKIGYNDQGAITTTFESEGKVIASSVDEFKSWASEQSSFKKILNGVDSSGADTKQSLSASGGKMTLTEQAIAANKANR